MRTEYEHIAVKALLAYYDHNYKPFLSYLDEAAIWYGPKEGEYIVGKQNIAASLEGFNHEVKFKVEDISTRLFPFSAGIYCVIVQFRLFTFKPDGTVRKHIQRVTFNGRRCKDSNGQTFWRCPYIEVSNLAPKSGFSDNNIISSSETGGRTLFFNGDNHTTLAIREDSIKFIEGGKGVCAIVHTDGDKIKVHHLLKDIEPMLSACFYRCHSSYIVNAKRIASMSTGSIILRDGERIPIPLKKSRRIIADIESILI